MRNNRNALWSFQLASSALASARSARANTSTSSSSGISTTGAGAPATRRTTAAATRQTAAQRTRPAAGRRGDDGAEAMMTHRRSPVASGRHRRRRCRRRPPPRRIPHPCVPLRPRAPIAPPAYSADPGPSDCLESAAVVLVLVLVLGWPRLPGTIAQWTRRSCWSVPPPLWTARTLPSEPLRSPWTGRAAASQSHPSGCRRWPAPSEARPPPPPTTHLPWPLPRRRLRSSGCWCQHRLRRGRLAGLSAVRPWGLGLFFSPARPRQRPRRPTLRIVAVQRQPLLPEPGRGLRGPRRSRSPASGAPR